jgi:Spy/CpxP family protein refolding chaperone
MKRIITSAFVIMLTIGAAQAQTTPDKHKGHKKEHNKAFDDLNLSADQKARLQSIRENFKNQSQELKSNSSLSAEQKQARRKELHQQFRSQIESVLTLAQKEQMKKNKSEWKEKRKEAKKDFKKGDRSKNAQGRGLKRGQDAQKELGLTADQQQKMQQLRSDFRNKFSSLRSDNSLTQEQKKTKMQELMKQQNDAMKSILTPEQVEKMQSQRKQRKQAV